MMNEHKRRGLKTRLGGIAAVILGLFLTAAGAFDTTGDLPLAHTETVGLEGVENLSIIYGGDKVILRESESNKLVIKEYMSRNDTGYYARVSRSAETVQIKRGKRPWFNWIFWKAKAEIYLPRSFRGDLRLVHSSGSVSGDADLLGYKSVDISISSGNALLNSISAESVSVRVSSGNMTVERIQGRTDVNVSSGSLKLKEFSGEGTFETSSGDLILELKALERDLNFKLSSGSITITTPPELSFNLDAVTGSGTVRVNENGSETLNLTENSTVLRPLGPSPERTIYVRTSSGDLTINRR
ncbi:MAG: DUF4097 domain-containing protein [Treponema sp.]|jgi:hypothetical protein|nr:DUF4097 domain-containing protein [Treponema sp.]